MEGRVGLKQLPEVQQVWVVFNNIQIHWASASRLQISIKLGLWLLVDGLGGALLQDNMLGLTEHVRPTGRSESASDQ